MAKPSWRVKDKYNAKTYDRVTISFKKTDTPQIKARAEVLGLTMSGYIKKLIAEDIDITE